MSQVELSERIGKHQCCISHYERGRSEPSLATMVDISDCLGISIDCILRDIEEKVGGDEAQGELKMPAITKETEDAIIEADKIFRKAGLSFEELLKKYERSLGSF